MTKVSMLKGVSNAVVVHVEGRSFPGIVIQGDTLKNLSMRMTRHLKEIKGLVPGKIYNNAEYVSDSLEELIDFYEKVLRENNMNFPY